MKQLIKNILAHLPTSFTRFARAVQLRSRIFFMPIITLIKILFSIPLKRKLSIIRFEVQVAEHCNLNCYACSNFSPVARPELVDVGEFTRDLTRMGEIFSHECERIFLLGGEPLLHPQINDLIRITRENFSKGVIFIFTNGLLLPSIDDSFWQACHDNRADIMISAYPIKLNMDRIRGQAEKFGVKLCWSFGESEGKRDTFTMNPLNLAGNSDIKLTFGKCNRAVNCITLSHGRLSVCSHVPNVYHFNEYFGKNIIITDEDSIDIYDEKNTKDVIFDKLREPIPACLYCRFDNRHSRLVRWGKSRKEISEWA